MGCCRLLICWLGVFLATGVLAQADPGEPAALQVSECLAALPLSEPALDRYARQLAGLADGKGADVLAGHAAQLERAFVRIDGVQLSRIRHWSAQALPLAVHAAEVVYYPFSGPDVLYVAALFPNARQMLFTGLEPVGAPPSDADFSSPALASSLSELRHSLATLLGRSFFVTAQMQQQFARNRFRGVTPILMLLLARSGFEIDSVTGLRLNLDGRLCAREFGALVDQAGVDIRYRRTGESVLRSLIYVRVDLSDDGLQAMPGYAPFVRQMGVQASYLKSASYLLHTPQFGNIRSLLLEVSPALLEDDSGIPFRYFPSVQWDPLFFGQYQSAAAGFGGHTQPDLRRAFAAAAPARLPFWIGYRHSKADSNLQLYLRRPLAR